MEAPTGTLETLSQKQQRFTHSLAIAVLYLEDRGYRASVREVYRTPEQAALNAKNGTGIANSVHCDGLAADIALFRDGRYLTSTEDYATLGSFWKGLGSDYRWGGDFTKPDGNHVSITHQGRA